MLRIRRWVITGRAIAGSVKVPGLGDGPSIQAGLLQSIAKHIQAFC